MTSRFFFQVPFLALSCLFFVLPWSIQAEDLGDIDEQSAVLETRYRINERQARRGLIFTLPNERVRMSVAPKAIIRSTEIVVREIAEASTPVPPTLSYLSPIYEYEVADRGAYAEKRRLSLDIIATESVRGKVFVWDEETEDWQQYPHFQFDGKTGAFRARFYASKQRFAVLQDHTEGQASWYRYKDCDCAASPDFPKGTKLRVTNLWNDKSVVVTVNDFGPERDIFPERVIDLDVTAFKKIARKGAGVIDVKIEEVL